MKTLNKTIASAFIGLVTCNIGHSQNPSHGGPDVESKELAMDKDHLMMQGGKMATIKEGKAMPMEDEMTLSDGTKVMTNGNVIMKNGEKAMLANGDMITMDGKIIHGGVKKDCVMMKDGKMMVMKNGKTMMMKQDMTLGDGTKVMTDGTCMMKDGKKMMMAEGDVMTMDGKMMKPTTTKDHIMMKDGKMVVMKGDQTMMMEKDMTLDNGTTVMADGNVKMKDGKSMMMSEGDMIMMDGKLKKSTDTPKGPKNSN